MEPDPALDALAADLERLGFVVVPHGRHICVRLPLLASVVVRNVGGTLRLQPQFGPFRRAGALLAGAVALPAAVAGAVATVGGVAALGVAAGAAAYLLTDVYRLILTESCVTRLQALWSARLTPASGAPALGREQRLSQLPGEAADHSQRPPTRAGYERLV